jgi:hypothetical protein
LRDGIRRFRRARAPSPSGRFLVDAPVDSAGRRDTHPLVIALVIFLGAVEFRGRHYLRHDRPAEFAGFVEAALRFLGRLPLVLIGLKNDRTVLRAEVRSLPVERRGIVNLPKYFEQLLERHARRVILDLHDFGVSRLAAADGSIVRFRDGAARVSNGHVDDALDRAKSRLDSPEASGAKYRKFVCAAHLPT